MKKIGLLLLLSVSFSMALAEDFCQTMGDFAGEVLEARKSGVSRHESISATNAGLADLNDADRAVAKDILNTVVNSIYDLPGSDIETNSAAQARVFKSEFVSTFANVCRQEFGD